MSDLFRSYRRKAGLRRDWWRVLRGKLLEGRLRRNTKALLAEGVPQFFIIAQDHISSRVLLNGIYERGYLDAAMDCLLRSGRVDGIAIDAGANIGNHSLYFSQFYKAVHAFEPNPFVHAVLRANASLAGNIVPHQVGLSDCAGSARLQIVNAYNLGSSTVAATADDPQRASCEIVLQPLDRVFADSADRIGLLKIDVENLELAVLTGAAVMLDRHSPVVFFEQHAGCFDRADGETDCVAFLRGTGYHHFYEVDVFPRVRWVGAGHLRNLLQHIMRIVGGYRYEVRPVQTFEKRFYSFIIASRDPLKLA